MLKFDVKNPDKFYAEDMHICKQNGLEVEWTGIKDF